MSVLTQTGREEPAAAREPAKQLALGRHELAAAAFILLAAALRLRLLLLGPPRIDSDEGTMGLMALHIAYHGQLPAFFYGQAYMGALEAYLAAGAFRLLGVSDFTLRLGLVLLAVIFLAIMYLLIDLIYGKRLALLSVALLSLGSHEVLSRQLKAVGGYPELLVLGAAMLFLASWLSVSPPPDGIGRRSKCRLPAYAGWGLAAGLGIWSDPLVLPFVAASGLLLLVACQREGAHKGHPHRGHLYWAPLACAVTGMLVGAFPLIAYNATAPPGHDTWSAVAQIFHAGGTAHTGGVAPVLQRVAGTILVSIPVLTGGNGICSLAPQDAWPLSARSSPAVVRCTVVHGVWGASFVALWLLAVVVVLRSLRRLRRDDPALDRQWARLALLGSAGLTLALFMLSPAPARAPWYNVRYLTGLWVALPAVIAPLAMSTGRFIGRRAAAVNVGAWALIAVLAASLLLDTGSAFGETPYVQWVNQRQQTLIADLLRLGARHIYSDYWTCDRLIFESRERIVCAVLDGRLRPSLDRYLPYRAMVRRDPRAAFVFLAGAAQARAAARIAARGNHRYRRLVSAGYVIYQSTPQHRASGILSNH